ncbi:hypothetical protein NFI96_019705 [Prochilodus magdalenae]|nr:hypothetical protein NFI96_019705 [Prochilodus magdalenae]
MQCNTGFSLCVSTAAEAAAVTATRLSVENEICSVRIQHQTPLSRDLYPARVALKYKYCGGPACEPEITMLNVKCLLVLDRKHPSNTYLRACELPGSRAFGMVICSTAVALQAAAVQGCGAFQWGVGAVSSFLTGSTVGTSQSLSDLLSCQLLYFFAVLLKLANLWGIVKGKMRYARPNNAEELKATIRATWALIIPEQCHRLIDSTPHRISAVIHAKGDPAKY